MHILSWCIAMPSILQHLLWKDASLSDSLSPVCTRVPCHSSMFDDEVPLARIPLLVHVSILHHQVPWVEASSFMAKMRYLKVPFWIYCSLQLVPTVVGDECELMEIDLNSKWLAIDSGVAVVDLNISILM